MDVRSEAACAGAGANALTGPSSFVARGLTRRTVVSRLDFLRERRNVLVSLVQADGRLLAALDTEIAHLEQML